MIANRWGHGGVAVDDGAYAEEVCNKRIDGGGLLEGPGDGGIVVTASDGSMPCPISAHQGKNRLLEDQHREFKVGISDPSLWVIPTNQIFP